MGKQQDLQQQQQQQQQHQQQLHLQQQNQQLQHQQQQSQAQLQPQLVYSPQVVAQCGSMYSPQIMFTQHNGNLMPITAIQQPGGNLIHMAPQYGNKQNKNVAIAASPQQPMQAPQQQPQTLTLLTTSQLPTLLPSNQQPTILPNPGKPNEPREKLATRNISSSVSPKVISQGAQQIQSKPHIISPMINNQPGLIAHQYKLLPQNSFVAGQSPQALNNSYYIQASPGPTGAYLGPNNQPYLPRTPNQSDQMLLVAPNPNFNTGHFFLNQGGFVSNNATSVISVSSSNSLTTTNTTQSVTNKGQTCAIAPATQHTPTTNRYKNLKPAIVQSSIGTQTLTPVINPNHLPDATSTPTTMNITKTKSHKNVQNSSNKVPIDKQESDGRQTMIFTVINNPSAAQATNEKTITPDNSRNMKIGTSDAKGTNKNDGSDQTSKSINDESKLNQGIQNKSQEKLKNKTVNIRNASNSALKEKMLQSSNKEMVEKKDAAIGNDVGLMVSVIPESNVSQDINNLSNGRKKPANGVRSNGLKSPRKAIVKPYVNDPNVLTHVIDGFVIQESQSPFPIDIEGLQETNSEGTTIDANIEESEKEIIIQNDQTLFDKSMSLETSHTPLKSKIDAVCECCCKSITKGNKKKKLKRFCSNICAKKLNTNANNSNPDICITDDFKTPDKTLNKFTAEPNKEMNIDNADNLSHEPNNKKAKIDNSDVPPESVDINEGDFIPASGTNPNLWNVQDVYDFVRNLPGCQEYADEFKSQEIDGQALMLLKEDHLMTAMNMKLGPALKICSRINSIFRAETAKS